jgi:hypothetical protein
LIGNLWTLIQEAFKDHPLAAVGMFAGGIAPMAYFSQVVVPSMGASCVVGYAEEGLDFVAKCSNAVGSAPIAELPIVVVIGGIIVGGFLGALVNEAMSRK